MHFHIPTCKEDWLIARSVRVCACVCVRRWVCCTQKRLRKPSFPEERGRWQWTRFNVTKYITERCTADWRSWYLLLRYSWFSILENFLKIYFYSRVLFKQVVFYYITHDLWLHNYLTFNNGSFECHDNST